MAKEPRVKFIELKGFAPVLENENKINTLLFLNAAKEIIGVIGEFYKFLDLFLVFFEN